MRKGKAKKKEIVFVVIVSVLSLLLCSGIGVYIWYSNSPFPTAIKMMAAFKEKDLDILLDCIEPEASQKIEMLLSLTGISTSDLMDMLLSANSDNDTNKTPQAGELRSFKFVGYERNGDTARISLQTASDDASANFDISFVRISGAWYLSFS